VLWVEILQGVRVIKLNEGDSIADLAKIIPDEDNAGTEE
jgi:hypothetical protein